MADLVDRNQAMGSVADRPPLPRPTRYTQPFWDAASEHRLVIPWCPDCDAGFFPPHFCGPRCLEEGWDWKVSEGRGRVYSVSIVHRAPSPGFVTPYVIAIVDLDDGVDLMTTIVGVDPEDVTIGARVRVRWQSAWGVTLPAFALDTEGESLP
jgi:uncharacterized OB-fold protein